ncbi:Gfo/Idh/MocA family protein [Oscillospiraceae bacterium LTW-04]|nr:Gfo/Idh/MocA family oxidoreductase [Oscillospiraceae bacterium MB24-C1]
MKYAIIGCGRIAKNHLAAALECGLNITAVCDLLPVAMQRLLIEGAPSAVPYLAQYTNYRRMLADMAPQIVAIATDSGAHAQIALDCIAAGAHIILEKPMAMSLEDANRIIKAAETAGVKVAVCHQNRFNNASQALYQAAQQNRFGKISHAAVTIRWNRGVSYYQQAAWRGCWQTDGGALMNQCIHGIDLLRWLMGGSINRVYGVCRNRLHPYIEAEDVGLAVLTFENGAVATIEGSTNIYPQNLEETLCIFGEKGTVKLGGRSAGRIEHWQFADGAPAPEVSERIRTVYGNGHIRLYADMLSAIKENRQPLINAKEGRAALELVLAIYKSQKEGRVLKLPLSDFSSVDMAKEFLKE